MGLWLGAALITFGCVSPFFSTSPLPAQEAGEVQTSIAGTAGVAMAQTQTSRPPTYTPSPTVTASKTATVTPTPTATVLFIYHSPTAVVIYPTYSGGGNPLSTQNPGGPPTKTSEKQYACDLISRYPRRSVVFGRNQKFNANWNLRNAGYWYWDRNSVDVEFVSGGHFHSRANYDIPRDVQPKETVGIVIPLTTPNKPGEYGATWTLRVGNKSFCRLRLEFTVE